jgi:hypothetical protein
MLVDEPVEVSGLLVACALQHKRMARCYHAQPGRQHVTQSLVLDALPGHAAGESCC